jgi:hypothetical protein
MTAVVLMMVGEGGTMVMIVEAPDIVPIFDFSRNPLDGARLSFGRSVGDNGQSSS